MRNYQPCYDKYSFNAEDDWGDYDNGKYRKPWFDKDGYSQMNYLCTDGEWHCMNEHVAKWIYFNGEIPEGIQVDHIIPIRNGGTNKLSNLRLLTPKDNSNNELTKINHSIANKKKWENDEYRQKMIDIHSSEEYKQKQSDSHKGKKWSSDHLEKMRTPIYVYSLDWQLVAVYAGRNVAEKETGYNRERISLHCKDGKEYKGHYWRTTPI